MFVRMTVKTETDVFVQIGRDIPDAPKRLNDAVYEEVIPASQARTDSSINRPLGPHKRPTDWESPKQERWWFGYGRFHWQGRHVTQGWIVSLKPNASGGAIVAENDNPGAPYIFETGRQIRMHRGVWMDTETYAAAESQAASEHVIAVWGRVAI